VTVCRALYALASGEQTTKEEAAAWATQRYPDWAGLVEEAPAQYRTDVHGPHRAAIRFVDEAVAEAERLGR
jgi:hypothetical protein